MKWKREELDEAIELLISGKTYEEIGLSLGRTKKSIKEKLNGEGYNQTDYNQIQFYGKCDCAECGTEFESLSSEGRKYCSKSCSATANNKLFKKRKSKEPHTCNNQNCENTTKSVYCSAECHREWERRVVFTKIEEGDTSLHSANYKKYLIAKYGEACMECGWNKMNPKSGRIPIELEHIDGDSENNSLGNLKLLCPNCHSLTPTYKSLNKGNGRHSRMIRYNDGKSF